MNQEQDKKCRYGHECTSGCGNDFDCPCQSEHCCDMTENCEGCDYCNLTPYQKIDEEFDEKFLGEPYYNPLNPDKPHRDPNPETYDTDNIKDFLHSALSSQAQEIMEKLPSEKEVTRVTIENKGKRTEWAVPHTSLEYKTAISDIKSLLSEYIANK